TPRLALLPTLVLLAGPALARDPQAATKVEGAAASPAKAPMADAPLSETQAEMLDMAFRAASAIPEMPHARDKAKAQESVIDACPKRDQPARAAGWLEQIGNWRRGAAHADLAYWLAQHGEVEASRKHLDQATTIAGAPEGEDGQDWHRDRIRAGIARTLTLL